MDNKTIQKSYFQIKKDKRNKAVLIYIQRYKICLNKIRSNRNKE